MEFIAIPKQKPFDVFWLLFFRRGGSVNHEDQLTFNVFIDLFSQGDNRTLNAFLVNFAEFAKELCLTVTEMSAMSARAAWMRWGVS